MVSWPRLRGSGVAQLQSGENKTFHYFGEIGSKLKLTIESGGPRTEIHIYMQLEPYYPIAPHT
jgi:hypothetical protein